MRDINLTEEIVNNTFKEFIESESVRVLRVCFYKQIYIKKQSNNTARTNLDSHNSWR